MTNKYYLNSKRGQIHISETIAVLFIFFVLIIFGLIFYLNYQKVALKEKSEELLLARSMEVTLKTLYLPELVCTRGEAELEINCIDVMKLNAAQEVMLNDSGGYYEQIFGYATITVQETYPENKSWIIYDKKKITTIGNLTSVNLRTEPTRFIVALRDVYAPKESLIYRFGYVLVEVY